MRHLIIGAGPAAQAAVETIRALDGDAPIDLVCDEPAYARMALPYYIGGTIQEEALMTADAAWFDSLGVTTHFGKRAARLARDHDRVILDDGGQLDFDRLLVATGSRPYVPKIPGADGPGAIPMWTLADARAFLAAEHREVVVVGAGFIAFTILDGVAERAETVSFVEVESQILPRMLDARAAARFAGFLAEGGIASHTGTGVEAIEPEGTRRRVVLSDGRSLACDLVVLATGARPNVEFLSGSGVDVETGIVVDARMATSRANVFAAGDVAAGPDLLGGPNRVQAIQPTATDHGRIAGANMVGPAGGLDVEYAGSLTMNILSARGIEAASFGFWEREDDVIRVESVGSVYRKYVFDGDRLVGGILVGPTGVVSGVNDVGMLKGLIQTGVSIGPWRSYLEQNPLDLRRAFMASGAAQQLLRSNLFAGRASSGGGYREAGLPPRRPRSKHHETLVQGL
jgi:NAD(P)H-nitrite reductase large subunit